ncbi:MAG: SRPBCC family protein [Bacteroidales bacterium]
MSVYQLHTSQFLPASLEAAWAFVSNPSNLKHITPESMGFEILNKDLPEKVYPGMMISYTVKPLLGIKTTWVTEITHVQEMKYFVDEQRVGPYSLWHHEHHLEPADGGVLMRDIVTYRPPFGILGKLANHMIIKRKLREIFTYREHALNKRFP